MNSFEVITKFLPKAIDKVFAAESKTAVLENGSKFIDVSFAEAGYVKIAEVLMDGLSDYYQVNMTSSAAPDYAHYAGQNGTGVRDGFQVGNAQVKWQLHQLQWKRGKQFQVDYIADEEMAGVAIANLLNEFNRTKVIPEVDAMRFSTIAKKCSTSLGNLVSESISANTIISKFNAAYEWLSEHEVPAEEQVIFVSPAVMTLIRSTTELEHRLTQADYKNGDGVEFTLKAYEGRPIIEVPSNRFFTGAVTSSNGYAPTEGSKVINFMICSKKAVVPLRKLEYSKVFSPEVVQDFYGYKIDYLLYHGIIIPKNKVVGCYTSVSTTDAAGAAAGKLSVLLSEGAAENGVKVDEYYTQPAGLLGTLAFTSDSSAITSGLAKVGDAITIDGDTWKLAEVEGEFNVSTDTHIQMVLVGSTGKALAVTADIDVTDIKK